MWCIMIAGHEDWFSLGISGSLLPVRTDWQMVQHASTVSRVSTEYFIDLFRVQGARATLCFFWMNRASHWEWAGGSAQSGWTIGAFMGIRAGECGWRVLRNSRKLVPPVTLCRALLHIPSLTIILHAASTAITILISHLCRSRTASWIHLPGRLRSAHLHLPAGTGLEARYQWHSCWPVKEGASSTKQPTSSSLLADIGKNQAATRLVG